MKECAVPESARWRARRKILAVTREGADNRKTPAKSLASRAAAALSQVVGVRRAEDAHRDGLTGLLDGETLHGTLAEAIRNTERDGGHIGLLFIDLDRFKRVNDRHGHVTGSRILSHVAGFLDDAARQAEGFAARYGGDEFVVVLPGADLDDSLRHAERLRANLAATILAGGEPPRRRPLIRVTCSIGAASMRAEAGGDGDETPSPAGAATRLLQLADNAMYQGKHAGRNRVVAAGTEATGVA